MDNTIKQDGKINKERYGIICVLFFYFVSILILTISCIKPMENNIALPDTDLLINNTLEHWIERKVELDYTIGYFTTTGDDTIKVPHGDAKFKILRYIDSTGCAPCRLQLTRFREVMTELSDSGGCKIDYLCIVASSDRDKIKKSLAGNFRKLPIWVDESDSINRMNLFPTVYGLQTFLLDKDDKVLAVGNPTSNPYIKKLFLRLITNDTIDIQDAPCTIILSEPSSLDLGNIKNGVYLSKSIKLKNNGEYPFVCRYVSPSCDCITAKMSPSCIAPGQEATVDIILDTNGLSGDFFRTITIYGNIAEELEIEISGYVVS